MGDTTAANPAPNHNGGSPSSFHVRPFDPAKDQAVILDIFASNIEEEWTKYHNAQYLPNAKKYIESVAAPSSDLNNIQQVYFDSGGFFWVVVENDGNCVVGMAGLEVKKDDDNKGELRRMCLRLSVRRQGLGTKLGNLVQAKAKELGLKAVFLSTTRAWKRCPAIL